MRNLQSIAAAWGARAPRRGGALALVVLCVLAVATLSAGMLQIATTVTRRQASTTNVKLAFYMAEAGLAEAYQGLSVGRTGNVGSAALPARFANGLFWVEATKNADGTVRLDSTGLVNNGRAELSLVVSPRLASVASLGVFAGGGLSIRPGMVIDGYDSGAPGYEPSSGSGLLGALGGLLGGLGLGGGLAAPETEPLGRLGANGPIHVKGTKSAPTVIDGDLTPGPGEEVTTSGMVTLNGSTVAAEVAVPLPSVSTPSFAPTAGIEHSGPVPHLVLPGDHQMPFLRADQGADVVVQGPATLVLDELELEDGAGLTLDTSGGPIRVFVTERLRFEPGTTVETPGKQACDLAIQVPDDTGESVLLGATSLFYGMIYAPEATVRVRAPFEVHGSLVGDDLEFVGPVKLHFDRHLEALAQDGALPRVVSWRILEFSNPPELTQVMNPFLYLGVTNSACPLPAQAHADQIITVEYTQESNGASATYDGWESDFDWGLVGSVQSLVRDGVSVNPEGGGLLGLSGLVGGLVGGLGGLLGGLL